MDVAAITIQDQGQVLCIQLAGGECARFHAQWLRDSDPGPAGRDPGNGQRVISILDIPEHVRILSASLGANQQLRLRFDDTDNNLTYSINWLLEHRYDCVQRRDSGWLNPETVAWHAQDPPELVAVSYHDMLADDRLRMQ